MGQEILQRYMLITWHNSVTTKTCVLNSVICVTYCLVDKEHQEQRDVLFKFLMFKLLAGN